MNVKELLVQAVLAFVVAGALAITLAINRGDERSQYRDRCACENCRCRCHIEGGTP